LSAATGAPPVDSGSLGVIGARGAGRPGVGGALRVPLPHATGSPFACRGQKIEPRV
jgi:hypothetical protein